MKLIYIEDVNQIVAVHDAILEISNGLKGIKDIRCLESVLVQIQNDDYYPYFEDKLTHLIFSVNKFHAFQDANKRTSIGVGALFLELNGFDYVVDKFIKEIENIAVCVADNIIDKELLGQIVYSIIYEEDYEEELKIKLFDALLQAERYKDTQDSMDDTEYDIF